MQTDEYLTNSELADRLKVKPKTIKNKMASGIFKKGVHYFSPKGLRPRFKWSAVVAWMEAGEERDQHESGGAIPMARGYFLKVPLSRSEEELNGRKANELQG